MNYENNNEYSYLLDDTIREDSTILRKAKVYAKYYSFIASYLSLCVIIIIGILCLIVFIQVEIIKNDVAPLINEFKDINMNDVYSKLESMADQKIGQFMPFIINSYDDIKKCVCPHTSNTNSADNFIEVSYQCPYPFIKFNTMEDVYCNTSAL
jgi:type II secretory pathway pseudopilin PulG